MPGGLLDVVWDADDAREVVAAPAGDDPQRRFGVRELAADLSDQAVAAHHDDRLAAARRPCAPPRGRARCSESGPAVVDAAVGQAPPAHASRSFRVRPPPADGLTRRRCVGSADMLVNLFAGAADPVGAVPAPRPTRAPRRRAWRNLLRALNPACRTGSPRPSWRRRRRFRPPGAPGRSRRRRAARSSA